jgi:hypothetical protein
MGMHRGLDFLPEFVIRRVRRDNDVFCLEGIDLRQIGLEVFSATAQVAISINIGQRKLQPAPRLGNFRLRIGRINAV